jgi:hypothetical protein
MSACPEQKYWCGMFIRHKSVGEVAEVGYVPELEEFMKNPENLRSVFFLIAVLVLLLGLLHWDFVGAINSVLLLFILYYLIGWSKKPEKVPSAEETKEEEG